MKIKNRGIENREKVGERFKPYPHSNGWRGVSRMSHGAVPVRDEAHTCQLFELCPQNRLQAARPSLHGLGAAGWYGSLCGFLHQAGGVVLSPFRLPRPCQFISSDSVGLAGDLLCQSPRLMKLRNLLDHESGCRDKVNLDTDGPPTVLGGGSGEQPTRLRI